MSFPGSGNIQLRIRNPHTIFAGKLLDLEYAATSAQAPVTVGLPESDFATIQDAIDAGRFSVVITKDTVVTENVVFGNNGCVNFKISILPGVTLTMQDAVFTDNRSPNPGRAMLEVCTLPGECGDSSGATPKRGALVMSYTAAVDPSQMPFYIGHLKLTSVQLDLSSPSVLDLRYLTCTVSMDWCDVHTYLLGNSTAAMSIATNSTIDGTVFTDHSLADAYMITGGSSSSVSFRACTFNGASTGEPSLIMGNEFTRCAFSSCFFVNVKFGSFGASLNWGNCRFFNCTLSSSPTGTVFSADNSVFDGCYFQTWATFPTVTGEMNTFSTCRIVVPGNGDFTLGGNKNTITACSMQFFGAGHLEITGDKNTISANTGGAFTVTLSGTPNRNKLIGNSFTGAITGVLGTNEDIGNSIV